MKRKILIMILAVAGIAVAKGLYDYNKPHKSIAKISAHYSLSSQELFEAYANDESVSNEKYLGKIIEIQGLVKEISKEDGIKITLETGDMLFGVISELATNATHESLPKVGENVKIKGLCSGMLMDVVLTNCHIVNN